MQYYVDVFIYDVDLLPGDSHWIGAWWGGFIICGGLFFILAIPFMAFPRMLVKEKEKLLAHKNKVDLLQEDQQSNNADYGKTIKGNVYKTRRTYI